MATKTQSIAEDMVKELGLTSREMEANVSAALPGVIRENYAGWGVRQLVGSMPSRTASLANDAVESISGKRINLLKKWEFKPGKQDWEKILDGEKEVPRELAELARRKVVSKAVESYAKERKLGLEALGQLEREAFYAVDNYAAILEEKILDALESGQTIETGDFTVKDGQVTAKTYIGLNAAWRVYKDQVKKSKTYRELFGRIPNPLNTIILDSKYGKLRREVVDGNYTKLWWDWFDDERAEKRIKDGDEAIAKWRGILMDMDKEVKPPVFAPSAGKYRNAIVSLNGVQKFADHGYAEPVEKAIDNFRNVILRNITFGEKLRGTGNIDLDRIDVLTTGNIQHTTNGEGYQFTDTNDHVKIPERPVEEWRKERILSEELREKAGPGIHKLLNNFRYAQVGESGDEIVIWNVERLEEKDLDGITKAYDIFQRPDSRIVVSLVTYDLSKGGTITSGDGVPALIAPWAGYDERLDYGIGQKGLHRAVTALQKKLGLYTADTEGLMAAAEKERIELESRKEIYKESLQEEALGGIKYIFGDAADKNSRIPFISSTQTELARLDKEINELGRLRGEVIRCENFVMEHAEDILKHGEKTYGARGKTVLEADGNHFKVHDREETLNFLGLLDRLAVEVDVPKKGELAAVQTSNWEPRIELPRGCAAFRETLGNVGRAIALNPITRAFGRTYLYSEVLPPVGWYEDDIANVWSRKKKLLYGGLFIGLGSGLGVAYSLGWIDNLLNQAPKVDFELRTPTRTLFCIAPTAYTKYFPDDGDPIIWRNKSTDDKTPLDKLKYNWYVQHNSTGEFYPINFTGDSLGRFPVSNDVGHTFKLIATDERGKQDSKTLVMPFDPARLPQYPERKLGIPIKGIVLDIGWHFLGEYGIPPTEEEMEEYLTVIKDMGCNAIRLRGDYEDVMLKCARKAVEHNFKEIVLSPRYWKKNVKDDITIVEHKERIINFANGAEELRRISNSKSSSIICCIGDELSISTIGITKAQTYEERAKEMDGKWGKAEYIELLSSNLREIIGPVRNIFLGPITYSAALGEAEGIDWKALGLDFVTPHLYYATQWYKPDGILKIINSLNSHGPIEVYEFGCLTHEGASKYGGAAWSYYTNQKYSQEEQGSNIKDSVLIFDRGNVRGMYLLAFLEKKSNDARSTGIMKYEGSGNFLRRKIGYEVYKNFILN